MQDVISHVFHSFQSALGSMYRAVTKFCSRHQNATPAHFINLSLNFAVGHCGGSVNMDADGGIETNANVYKEKIGSVKKWGYLFSIVTYFRYFR